MGNFTDRLKKLFNPKAKTSQTKKDDDFIKVYFVRSVANKKMFIHPDGTDIFKPVYALKPGPKGAPLFTNEMAELLIINWLAETGEHLEKIWFDDLKREGGL